MIKSKRHVISFKFVSENTNINPENHVVWVTGYVFQNNIPFAIGEPKVYPFEFDKDYSLDFTGRHPINKHFLLYSNLSCSKPCGRFVLFDFSQIFFYSSASWA